MKTLISIISEQTLPNVLFAKEKGTFDRYIFVYTDTMVGKLETLKKVLKINTLPENEIKVLEDSLENIIASLSKIDFADNEDITVNLTGGTKVMAIGVYNFFAKKQCKIFYIAFPKNEIVQIFPEIKQAKFDLLYRISLLEYLQTYNIDVDTNSFNDKNNIFDMMLTQNIFSNNTQVNSYSFRQYWKSLHTIDYNTKMQSFINLQLPVYANVRGGLTFLNYTPLTKNTLSKSEIQYFSGSWWEEYLYTHIKNKLNLSDDEIGLNIEINRNNLKRFPAGNEFDILFVYQNRLYVLECKTGIYDVGGSGMQTFNEFVYKLSALRKFFGLGVKLALCILQPLPTNTDKKTFFKDRTDVLNIQLFEGSIFNNINHFIQELIK